jgi:hypothetical protein
MLGLTFLSVPATAQVSNAVVAQYRFNDSAEDSSGYMNHGWLNGPTSSTGRWGLPSHAYRFDGIDDSIYVENSDSLSINNFQGGYTVSAWIFPARELSSYQVIFSKGINGFSLRLTGGVLEACHQDTQGRTACLAAGIDIPVGVWSHVAVSYDALTGERDLYHNGEKGNYTASNDGLMANSDGPVAIGRDARYDRWHFSGKIDSLMIRNRGMTEEEMADLFLGGETRSISAGDLHSCGIKTGGAVRCWGLNDYGQTSPLPGTYSSVSAGGFHSCGVVLNGSVQCWGDDSFKQSTPPPGTFSSVSAGGYHSCGVQTDGALWCWGDNYDGQSTEQPGAFSLVSAGYSHTCALTTDRAVHCWGYCDDGQCSPPPGVFATVSAGMLHSCGVRVDGSLICWGDAAFGPTTAPPGTYTSVSAGLFHTCGVQTGGAVRCWGDDYYGQSVAPPGSYVSIAAGGYHTCGFQRGDILQCWGDDSYGQSYPASDSL